MHNTVGKKKSFIIIGIFWIVIIGGLIAFKEFTLQTGDEVLLKTRLVDPRDLFRGDYVVLSYDIGSVNMDVLPHQGSNFNEGDKVYVSLNVDDNKIGTLTNIEKNKPSEGIFVAGTVKSTRNNRLSIGYGIESYFIPEGTGEEIERSLGKIYTKVAVDNFGNAVIKSLVLDGENIDLD